MNGDFLPPETGLGDDRPGLTPAALDSLARWMRRPLADIAGLAERGGLGSAIEDRQAELRAHGWDSRAHLAAELEETRARVTARSRLETRARLAGDAAACLRYMNSRR